MIRLLGFMVGTAGPKGWNVIGGYGFDLPVAGRSLAAG
jgi:hypothetical protein